MRTAISTLAPLALIATACPAQAKQPDARAVALAVADRIDQKYVVDTVRPRLVALLRASAATGRYDGLTEERLADQLTADMAIVAHDLHLGVQYAPAQAALLGKMGQADDADADPEQRKFMASQAFGVRDLALMPGNIRYLAYDGFMSDGAASEAMVDAAMRFLQGGDAIVIDLRSNGGGDPRAVATLASYFLPPGTALARFEMHDAPAQTSATHRVGLSLAGKPLYVLVGPHTASAAEEFATHVKAFRLGELVGATTAGAAYRNDLFALPGGFVLSVSVGRPVHARTGGNWERTGVTPTIPSEPDAALDIAQANIFDRQSVSAAGDAAMSDRRLAVFYHARAAAIVPAHPLSAYRGRYGERSVSVSGSDLIIERDGGRRGRLIPLKGDRFAMELDPTTQVSFDVTEGRAVGLELSRANGELARDPRR